MSNHVRLVHNERSWAIDLISEINKITNLYQLNIAGAGGEKTINNSQPYEEGMRKIMFPDLLLYGDAYKNKIIHGWEIKLPDVPVTDDAYIKDAQYKADTLKVDSTVLWNFNQVVLYVKEKDEWKIAKQWNDLTNIRSRQDVETYRDQWVRFLGTFIVELSNFYDNRMFTSKRLEEVSDSIMVQIIERNKKLLANHLETISASNRRVKTVIDKWWKYIKNEYMGDETNFFEAYSKNILLNWINRFTFANFIKNTHTSAREIQNVTNETTPQEANDIFKNITESADFFTIFEAQEFNQYIPNLVWEDLVFYNLFLQDKIIAHESLQKLLEGTVNSFKRQVIGQFTTPQKLAQLLVRATTIDATGNAIDPCCGTGTIPKSIMNLKRESGLSVKDIHQTTWAADKYSFPLQIANLAMTSSESMNIANRVFQKNVFNLIENDVIEIRSPEDGKLVQYPLPKFKTIVSNLPFVPFEIISDDQILLDAQKFAINESTDGAMEFNGRSDLYEYIAVFLNNLLDVEGRIGVILSNSWLASASGKNFYKLLLHLYKIKSVISSGNKKWFKNADVMSTILILEKKEVVGEIQNESIQFLLIEKPLESLTEDEINDIGDSVLQQEFCENTSGKIYSISEIEDIQQYNLSLNALFYDVSWIENVKDKIVRISTIFTVMRGERRGWDRLFYPEDSNNIESKYLKRVLKSTRNIEYLTAETDKDAFCCSASIEELEQVGDFGALNWINRFKHDVNGVGRPLPEVLRRRGMHWYEMKEDGAIAEFVTSINPEKRLFWARLEEPSFINQRLTGLNKINNELDSDLLHALLNSILGKFFIESSGFGRGLGALDTSKNNIENTFMLNPFLVSNDDKINIINAFDVVKREKVNDTLIDIQGEEVKGFDLIVLEAFGIKEYYEEIKNSLEKMMKARLSVKN